MTRARNYGRLIPFILSKETIYSSCHDICFGSDKRGFLSFIFMFPLSNCQPFTLPFWSKRERGKMVQLSKWKKNNSQPSSFFYQLPSLLSQRKHLVPSVPPEKRGKKERSQTLHPKCQWGQRGCQLPRTTRCWKTASLNEGCAFRKPSWWRSWLLLPKMAVLAWGKLHRCLYPTSRRVIATAFSSTGGFTRSFET